MNAATHHNHAVGFITKKKTVVELGKKIVHCSHIFNTFFSHVFIYPKKIAFFEHFNKILQFYITFISQAQVRFLHLHLLEESNMILSSYDEHSYQTIGQVYIITGSKQLPDVTSENNLFGNLICHMGVEPGT